MAKKSPPGVTVRVPQMEGEILISPAGDHVVRAYAVQDHLAQVPEAELELFLASVADAEPAPEAPAESKEA